MAGRGWRLPRMLPWAVVLLCAVVVMVGHVGATYPSSVTGFYTDSSAQQTVLLHRSLSSRQKKELRNEILQLLGLERRPRPPAAAPHPPVPPYMLQLYQSLGQGSVGQGWAPHNQSQSEPLPPTLGPDTLGGADLIMGFVNQARIRALFSDDGRRFYFDFSEVKSTEMLTTAQLRLYKFMTPWLTDRDPFTVNLYKVKDLKYKSETVLEPVCTLVVHALTEGWLDLDTTQSLRSWALEPDEQVLMYLEVTDSNGVDMEPALVGLVDGDGPEDKQAFLLAVFEGSHKLQGKRSRVGQSSRVKRSQPPGSYYGDEKDYGWKYPEERTSRRACQRRQLHVSFTDLGWESWVIAPEGYPAFYCEGACTFPLNVHMNATNHAIVQALVHLVNPFLAPNPCCAPTKLSAISFLYLDNSYNVVLKQYKNMVVQACGCH